MDVDIIIDRDADTINVQQDEFAKLIDLAKTRPEVKFETLIELSQLRSETKRKVIDDISGANDPMAAQMAQMQKQLQDLQMRIEQANLGKIEAETAKIAAETKESAVDAAVKIAEFITNPVQPAAPKTSVSVN